MEENQNNLADTQPKNSGSIGEVREILEKEENDDALYVDLYNAEESAGYTHHRFENEGQEKDYSRKQSSEDVKDSKDDEYDESIYATEYEESDSENKPKYVIKLLNKDEDGLMDTYTSLAQAKFPRAGFVRKGTGEIDPSQGIYPYVAMEFDYLADKPWQIQGADISDWFNFGYDEEKWRLYVNKQILMRFEKNMIEKQIQDKNPQSAAKEEYYGGYQGEGYDPNYMYQMYPPYGGGMQNYYKGYYPMPPTGMGQPPGYQVAPNMPGNGYPPRQQNPFN